MKLTKPQQLIYDSEKVIGGSVAVMCGIMTVDKVYPEEQVVSAIKKIYETNDALNYRLDDSGSEPHMYYESPKGREVKVVRVDALSELEDIGQKIARTPLDLTGWLSDLTAIIHPNGYGIIVTLHHLLGDAWSMSLIGTQLNAILEGTPWVRYSYENYINAEKEYLESKKYERDRKFFLREFEQSRDPLLLSDKQSESFCSDVLSRSLSPQLRDSLNDYAERTGNSEFVCLLGAFSVLYGKLKNCADSFFVGMPVLNRFSEKDMNTVGMYVNTVPVPVHLDYDASFADNLQQLQYSVFSVFKHQKFNYNDILKTVREEYGFSGKLYDCTVNYETDEIFSTQTMRSKEYHREMQTECLQLFFQHRNRGAELVVEYTYHRDVFSAKEIERLHTMFMRVLNHLLNDDTTQLKDIVITDEAEKEKLLHTFNNTAVPYDKTKSVYELFEEQVKKCKQAYIEDGEQKYTFAKLDENASVIDACLRKKVGTEKQVIGVICERSYEELAAIFGIVRGGNAYMPISPEYPEERIETMLETSGCNIVLAQKKYCNLVESAYALEDILSEPEKQEIPSPAAKADDTLYVIYTSGSTGTPKGAMVSNRSAINRIGWMAEKYFDASSVIMLKTPYTFDVSVWEIFGFAMYGFSLYVLPPDLHYSQKEVLSHIEKGRVTDLHFVPTVFEQFLSVLKQTDNTEQKLNSLKNVILSGESLPAKAVNEFGRYHNGRIKVHNLYGPAECAVDVTSYECAKEETDPIPIGKPISNTQIYIVDKYLNPVPIGVTGELCIAGDNVGQGYLNRPELTAEKFVDNPFGEGKLYKTGDLAYWREDGNIIFAGRNDFQIKINGQRVELGEIESALIAIEEIESAAVIVKQDDDRQLLCAFYTGKEFDVSELRSLMGKSLTRYMVPQVFEHLEEMPLNTSGKIDRIALEQQPVFFVAQTYEAPQTAMEAEICRAFCEILGAERIGRNDNFYDFGGTSLQIVQLLSRPPLNKLSVSDFMAEATPAALAKKLDETAKSEYNYIAELYKPVNAKKAIVLFPFAGGDAAAYTALVAKAREEKSEIALYFVDWFDESQIDEIADEIRLLSEKMRVSFYSHCAGSALAMMLLDVLNKKETVIQSYIAGASIPPGRLLSRINIWNYVSDNVIMKALKRSGLQTEVENNGKLPVDFSRFRRDTHIWNNYFRNKKTKTNVCVTAVISKKDPFTKNYSDAKSLWQKAVKEVNEVLLIDTPSHYFQNTDSELLLGIFKKYSQGGK